MNIAHIHIKLTDCRDCKFCDTNGEYATKQIWVCHHHAVAKGETNNKNIKHWYESAVIGPVRVRKPEVLIPDWCPYVEKV